MKKKKLVKFWCPGSQCANLIVAAIDGESIEVVEAFSCGDVDDIQQTTKVEERADKFIKSLKESASGYADSILTPLEEVKIILTSMLQGAEECWKHADDQRCRSYHMGSHITIGVILDLIEKYEKKGGA